MGTSSETVIRERMGVCHENSRLCPNTLSDCRIARVRRSCLDNRVDEPHKRLRCDQPYGNRADVLGL
jgi:hypothetical protein